MITPDMVRLLVIVIGLGLLTTGMVITVIKRHEKGGLSAGAFLLTVALIFGIAFNSVANSARQNAQKGSTAETAITWLEERNHEVRTAIISWLTA